MSKDSHVETNKVNLILKISVLVTISITIIILVTIALYLTNNDKPIETTKNASAYGEKQKLLSATNLRDNLNMLEMSPRPFGNVIKGLVPASFSTTPKYDIFPQLNGYRNPGYPRNIQEIVGYLTNNNLYKNENHERDNIQKYSEYHFVRNKPIPLLRPMGNEDPFSTHKPHDPSDVNLLAMGNFRFAPPAWGNFIKNNQNVLQQMSTKHEEVIKQKSKVTHLILSVIPNGDEYKIIAQTPGRNHNLPRNPLLEELKKRNIQPKRFILYINFYDTDLQDVDENLENSS